MRKNYQEKCLLCMGTATNNTPEGVTLLPVTLLKSMESPEAMQHAGKQH